MRIYNLVDKHCLYAGTVETSIVETWIESQTKYLLGTKIKTSVPSANDYAIAFGYKAVQIVSPPTPTPVVGCWKWCGIKNTWKLNDDPNTFPTALVLQLRQKAYKKETDGLKLDADFNAILNNTTPDYTAWMEAKLRIRSSYPIQGQ